MNSRSHYIKHIYSVTEAEKNRLKKEMVAHGVEVSSTKGVPCRSLDEKDKVAIVNPEDWNNICARQGSWYRYSERNGLYLFVSSFELEEYENKKESVITLSDFFPPEFATVKEKEKMIEAPIYAHAALIFSR